MKSISYKKRLYLWFLRWLVCWAELVSGIVGVITLGFWRRSWVYNIVVYWSKVKGRYLHPREE